MTGGVFLLVVLVVCVGQVLFDMATAPEESTAHTELGTKSIKERALESHREGIGKAPRRRELSEAVRKGTPSNLRRDLYFYFIEGSWTRVFVAFAFRLRTHQRLFLRLFTCWNRHRSPVPVRLHSPTPSTSAYKRSPPLVMEASPPASTYRQQHRHGRISCRNDRRGIDNGLGLRESKPSQKPASSSANPSCSPITTKSPFSLFVLATLEATKSSMPA